MGDAANRLFGFGTLIARTPKTVVNPFLINVYLIASVHLTIHKCDHDNGKPWIEFLLVYAPLIRQNWTRANCITRNSRRTMRWTSRRCLVPIVQ